MTENGVVKNGLKRPALRMDWKVINDSVHGHIPLHPLLVSVIDTPHFQRLRNLKQLGVTYFVYPSACHNRFEHSLGTAYLAGKLLRSLYEKSNLRNVTKDAKKINELCVQVAGLCHDIGHGPFSHTWEKFLEQEGITWHHENCSIQIFRDLLQQNVSHRDGEPGKTLKDLFAENKLKEKELKMIEGIILGQAPEDCRPEDYFIYQIVCNLENGVDVDKWEYLSRDGSLLNVPVSFDYKRLLEFSQVLKCENDRYRICFRDKECRNLCDMFLTRGCLHNKAYQHPRVKTIEQMLIDAFRYAARAGRRDLNLLDTSPENIMTLTDHIYQVILFDKSDDQNMLLARQLLQRIERRDLYVCLGNTDIKQPLTNGKVEGLRMEIWKSLCNGNGLQENEKPELSDIRITQIKIYTKVAMDGTLIPNIYIFEKRSPRTGITDYKAVPFTSGLFSAISNRNMEAFEHYAVMILYAGNHLGTYGRADVLRLVNEHMNKFLRQPANM